MIDVLEGWTGEFGLVSIEDGLAEDDWNGWTRLTERLGQRIQVLGDDLFATSLERLQSGIARGAAKRGPRRGQPGRDADRGSVGRSDGQGTRLRYRRVGPVRRN